MVLRGGDMEWVKNADNVDILLFLFILGVLFFVVPDIFSAIFNIGVEVGQALAKWF